LNSVLTNIPEIRSIHQMNKASRAMSSSMEKLATGKRINRASDDPSGLIAADHLSGQAKSIRAEISKLERAVYLSNARDGAEAAVGDMLLDLQSIIVTAASTGATTREEREALQVQAVETVKAIDFVFNTSTFGGIKLLEGGSALGLASVTGPAGEDGQTKTYSLHDIAGDLNLVDGNMELAQQLVNAASGSITHSRAERGALVKNQFESRIDSLYVELENTVAAESIIRDTDYAAEVSSLVRSQVLREAALQMTLVAREHMAKSTLALLG
jgi:flagellin